MATRRATVEKRSQLSRAITRLGHFTAWGLFHKFHKLADNWDNYDKSRTLDGFVEAGGVIFPGRHPAPQRGMLRGALREGP